MNAPKMARAAWLLPPLLLGSATMASAAEQGDPPEAEAVEPPPTEPADAASTDSSRKWQFATITYGWLAGVEGQTDLIEPVDPIGLDLSFGDVMDAFKFAFMGAAEARRDRLVFLGDLTFIHLGTKKGIDIRDQDFLEADLDTRTIDITALGGYRVATKGVLVDLMGGVRANFLKTSLELTGPNRTAADDVSQTWFDPLLGARAYVPLGGKLGLSLYGDVGGFGIASDLTWQASATVDYDINRKFRALLGWRYFKVDYDKGDFLYDVAQSGLFIGLRTVL